MAGVAPPSGRRSKVDAVIQSAVVEDSTRPATAIRAISTCSLPASGPRRGANQCRQPPARRATSAAPERREDQHRGSPRGHGQTPAVPEEQRPVQVRQPAFGLVRVGRGHALTRRRVDHGGARRALIEPVGGDPTGGRSADLLHARIDGLDAVREGGDGQSGFRLRRGDALGRRENRQCRAAQAQDDNEREGQETRPAMECTDHGPAPHMS
jgi:hypothetical protein